ncbi:MAG: L-serine ammonia-lyase [Acidobacteriota bacterium]
MEQISVFDIFKVGIGPSSSHTMGPWNAARMSLTEVEAQGALDHVCRVQVDLYGSLAKTGKGHGTDVGVLLGLGGEDHATIDTSTIDEKVAAVHSTGRLDLAGRRRVPFDLAGDLHFHGDTALPFHPNGICFRYELEGGKILSCTYYSIGGGFVVKEHQEPPARGKPMPFPIQSGQDLAEHCQREGKPIADIVMANERSRLDPPEIHSALDHIWETMQEVVYRGCHAEGELPGGLKVRRRAPQLARGLLAGATPGTRKEWLDEIRGQQPSFRRTLRWVSCFAIATNEENADFGRVVTAPTNGSAGVIPAVLLYYVCFSDKVTDDDVRQFLLVAGEFGSLFKKGATISAAMGGCQAEIGVSSAMAAAALAERRGGTPGQVLMAAEIAMEHHLGMTCDPVGGLVQIPCIERNSMGAIKAITAANLALEGDPELARVSLDAVIRSMWDTARDMSTKYKETAEGGLAVHLPVNLADC